MDPPALRQRLFQDIGLRLRSAGWWTIAVLLATGVINLYYKGWLRWDGVFGSLDFWRTTVGHTLALKLATVAMMMTVSAVHDFVLGPLAGRAIPGSDEAIVLRRRAAHVARANALLGVLIVAIAVRLAPGG